MTQEYDWAFRGAGAAVADDAFHASLAAGDAAAVYDAWACAPGRGGMCALTWQKVRRQGLDGVDARPARAVSPTHGLLCTEPVPYTFDAAAQRALPASLLSRYVGVRELHFAGRGLEALPAAVGRLKTLESPRRSRR